MTSLPVVCYVDILVSPVRLFPVVPEVLLSQCSFIIITPRAIISTAFGRLFVLAGSPWWMGVLMGGLASAFFTWAPRSGRYVVHPELGATPLRRDEHTQAINDKAARNAFVVIGFALPFSDPYDILGSPIINLTAILQHIMAVLYYPAQLLDNKMQ